MGNVPNPKNNMNTLPFIGVAAIIEDVNARYTSPHGRNQFNIPINNNELNFLD